MPYLADLHARALLLLRCCLVLVWVNGTYDRVERFVRVSVSGRVEVLLFLWHYPLLPPCLMRILKQILEKGLSWAVLAFCGRFLVLGWVPLLLTLSFFVVFCELFGIHVQDEYEGAVRQGVPYVICCFAMLQMVGNSGRF